MKKANRVHGYKYTMYDRLRKMTVEDYEIAMKWLPIQIGITTGTFRNWIYIKPDHKIEIPALAVIKMSAFFDCQPIDLFTYPFDNQILIDSWNRIKSDKNIQLTLDM